MTSISLVRESKPPAKASEGEAPKAREHLQAELTRIVVGGASRPRAQMTPHRTHAEEKPR